MAQRSIPTVAPCAVVIIVIMMLVATSSAFVPELRVARRQRAFSTQPLNVVFHQLSNGCITALKTAQEQAGLLKQQEVGNALMLLGLCESPGKTKSTMDKYQINWRTVRPILNSLLDTSPQVTSDSSDSSPRLAAFSPDKEKEAVPYSQALQKTLHDAGKLAQQMGSSTIQSEHMFLALFDYREEDGEPVAAARGDSCEAMEVVEHINAELDGYEICESLLEALLKDRVASEEEAEDTPTTPAGVAGETEQKKTVRLEDCGVDLTKLAREGKLDIVHGRDEEIRSCLRILVRRRKNNACIIGEAGVGKTAIAEGLASVLVSDACPELLQNYRLFSLELSSLVAGTKFRGEFEERFRSILKQLKRKGAPPTILFLDEIHQVVGTGGTGENSMDAANLLKPSLARGELQIIGATTITEYNKHIAKDAALERRLQPLLVKEPSIEQTLGILRAIQPSYEKHHRVKFLDESLQAAAKLSDRYIHDRFLPDKAIDILDEAGALAHLGRTAGAEEEPKVTEEMVANVVSEWSNVPVNKMGTDEMDRLQNLEEEMASRVKGQDRAVRTVAKAVRRARSGIRNPSRPIASLMFCGPTGTGKTELCKTLADTYFGDRNSLVRIDMSEYMDKHTVSRLTGPPPGYKGYEEGGQLTEAVRRAPHSVVLLDELEKAHPEVLNVLLQVMEDGILTDGTGRTVSFKNTILVMTSNIGSKRVIDLVKQHRASDKAEENDGRPEYSKLSALVRWELENALAPELLNRIDDVVVFEPLSNNELSMIAAMMVVDTVTRVQIERNIGVRPSGALMKKIVKEGSMTAGQFGARPMRRAVQRVLEDAISDAIVQGFLTEGDVATFDLKSSPDEDNSLDDKGSFEVFVCRTRGDETMCVELEEPHRDMILEEPEIRPVSEIVGPNGDSVESARDAMQPSMK